MDRLVFHHNAIQSCAELILTCCVRLAGDYPKPLFSMALCRVQSTWVVCSGCRLRWSHTPQRRRTLSETPPMHSVFDFEFVFGVVCSEIFHANKVLGTPTCSFRGPVRGQTRFKKLRLIQRRPVSSRHAHSRLTSPLNRRTDEGKDRRRGRTLQSLAQSKLCQRSLHLNTRKHTRCLHEELAPFQNLLPRFCFCEGVTVQQGISRLCLLGPTVPSCHHRAMQIQDQPGFPGTQGTADVYGGGLQFR